MDRAQMAELRKWAEALERESASGETRAAARAILLLAAEVDRLDEELERARSSSGGDAPGPPPASGAERRRPPRGASLREWLASTWGSQMRSRRARRLVLALAFVAALVFATLALGARLTAPELHAQGPAAGAVIGPAALEKLAFAVRSGRATVRHARWRLDGTDVTARALVVGDTAVLRASGLSDGAHQLSVHASGGFPGSGRTHRWRFAVDTTPPRIRIPETVSVESGAPIRIGGSVEPGARVTLAGRRVPVRDGRFSVPLASLPAAPLVLHARDAAGNTTARAVRVALVPRRPPAPVRAVHVTSFAWATESLREPVLRLADEHRIDAVELDLKDESGAIGWYAAIPLARKIGSAQKIYDLAAAVRLLHARGLRVIGRLVAFRDPILASAAWKAGNRDQVIQTPDGGQYLGSGYGGFTNFANPVVRKYNVDIAVAAARAGVDEVLYDYVRRPDGPLPTMVFPGLKGSAAASIASFLAEARAALAPYRTFLGASVFGVAATRPDEVAQEIPLIARHVDYVAPMVYPSHWGPGEYGVASPNAQPYDIVVRSLRDFQRDVAGTGARVVPWLQDFSLGVAYGPAQVNAQIKAAADDGIDEFLLWDPAVTYHGDALRPMSERERTTPPEVAAVPRTQPNELGLVPVLMYHQILPSGGGDYDLTPAQFRAELERLWRDGFVPIRASELVRGTIDVPAGKSPVVLTFDDSSNNQLKFLPDGSLDPSSAIGILTDFARTHPGFRATATFFVLREPFTGSGVSPEQALRWLLEHGFELGDHTKDHTPLRSVDDTQVQRELVLGARIIHRVEPGAPIVSMALPLGSYPKNATLALSGSWGGESYRFGGVFLVGAEPAPSPFSTRFDPANIPRIKTSPARAVRDFGSSYWLDMLERQPGLRYVSDGNPRTIAFPAAERDRLASRFAARARPY